MVPVVEAEVVMVAEAMDDKLELVLFLAIIMPGLNAMAIHMAHNTILAGN